MRLLSLQSKLGMYGFVSIEPIVALLERWGLDKNAPSTKELFLEPAISKMISIASSQVTGMVLDPVVGLSARVPSKKDSQGLGEKSDEKLNEKSNEKSTVNSSQSGLLLPLSTQQSAEVDPLAVPKLSSDWGVVEIANNYGVAILTLYYHPEEEKALQKKQIVAELADYCKYEGIDFILDLVVYTPAGQQFDVAAFQAAQITAIQELRFAPSAFMLQYPLDPLACATLTTELDIPWLVSSRGLRYSEFKETLRTSLEGGAVGFCLHELSWPKGELDHDLLQVAYDKNDMKAVQEIAQDWLDSISKELETTIRDQYIELMRITNEFSSLDE